MKRLVSTALAIALVGVVISGLAKSGGKVTEQDKSTVARLTQKMKTVCVGRFLIDMPKGAEVELRQVRVDGFDISAFDETDEEFQKRLAEREAQIRASRTDSAATRTWSRREM